MQVKDKVLDGVGKYFVAHGLGLFFWCWVGGGVGEEDRRLRKEKLPLQYLDNSRSLVYMQIIPQSHLSFISEEPSLSEMVSLLLIVTQTFDQQPCEGQHCPFGPTHIQLLLLPWLQTLTCPSHAIA